MKFYDESTPVPETSALGVGLGVRLLHLRDGMNGRCDAVPDNATVHVVAFARKSTSRAEWQYSNIEHKALGMLHELEIFHYYIFA